MKTALYLLFAVVAHGAAGEEFFETKIRPLLIDRCGNCHGDRAASGLRVDSREALLRGGKHGPAIVPGDAAASLLLQAVKQTHASLRMPPNGPLPDAESAAIETWIRDGAAWPANRPAPKITTRLWGADPLQPAAGSIDSHVRAALVAKGIPPNPRADNRTLLRRLYADLTGVPATPAQAEAFLSAPNVPALVDALLASPQFGERWGRHWLDVARFGEDDFTGTQPKPYPNAWRYRDWVIEQFNKDLPYNTFVKAQIAADLLPGDNTQLVGGLGLFGLGPWYYGITQPPQARADERHDRVDMVTRGFLGLTVACARCHDHKYDPIPQKDYYALAGVFASSEYKEYPLATPAQVAAYDSAQKKIKALELEIERFVNDQRDQLTLIYARQAADYLMGGKDLDPIVVKKLKTYLAKPEEDHPFLKAWNAAPTLENARAFQETLLAVIDQKRVMDEENRRAVIRGSNPAAKRRKIILPFNYDSEADFNPGSDVPVKSLDRERYQLWQKFIGRADAVFRIEGDGMEARLAGEWKRHLSNLRAELDRAKKSSPPVYGYFHGLMEHEEPIDLALNKRGSPTDLGDIVPRHFLTCLSAGEPATLQSGSGRLQLAEAITNHPQAARVMANRIWAWLFGAGVSRTPSNFGLMGERPANRPLIEYLAARLKENGFSMKGLIREIVLSETYLASSASAEAGNRLDPDNRLFWRSNRKRLDAETIRDSILAASGELDRRVGGESADLSDTNLRRTVYVRVGRYQQNETLALFDFPSTSIHVEQRGVTNVPLQKLFFLNSSFLRLRAEALSQRLECASADDASRIQSIYRQLFHRPPTEHEKTIAAAFLAKADWAQYAQVLLSSNEFLYVD
ncbi:MAG TPA: PSD1 and planctomycete cytochrome C domain-containing protein [Bryobacteraceae bacterium]|nr:PSD1 and planctomycete cytochrome C domain-containing protein [Bryobacteraceae bacterium]